MSNTAFTKKELASFAGYTYRRLYDIDMALPEDKKLFIKSENGKYDIALFIQRWVDYNVNKGASQEEKTLDEVRAIHEQIKTQKTELEVARMRGELVSVEDVRRLWGGIASTVMQNMIRLPSKVAPQVIMMDNPDVIGGIIEKEVRDVLCAIADTPVTDGTSGDGEADEEKEEQP